MSAISEVDIRDWQQGELFQFAGKTGIQDKNDVVNHPKHYTSHPSGVECIQITEHMGFLLGNAMKYLWRADLKNGVEDLQKAVWYLNREIEKRTK